MAMMMMMEAGKWKRGGVTGGLALPRVSIRLPILLPTLSTELDHDDLDGNDWKPSKKNNTNTATIAQFSLPMSIGWVALSFRVGLFVCPAWMTSPSVFHFVYKQMLENCSCIALSPGSRNHHQRHKKSKLSSWQNITRKNFPDRAYKSFLRQKCAKSETFQTVRKLSRLARKFPHCVETFQII